MISDTLKIERERTRQLAKQSDNDLVRDILKNPLVLLTAGMVIPEYLKGIKIGSDSRQLINQTRVDAMQAAMAAVVMLPVLSPYFDTTVKAGADLAGKAAGLATKGAGFLV